MQSLAQQASAYVTTSTIPSLLPGYVNLDPVNDWTSSALMATAIETVTLPSRLRELGGRQASLSLLVDMLNTDGRQNIFELAASVPWRTSSGHEDGPAGDGMPGFSNEHANTSLAHSSQTNRESNSAKGTPKLDINFATELSNHSQGTDAHIFSQAVIQRGLIGNSDARNTTDRIMRPLPSSDTVVEKLVHPYPCKSSMSFSTFQNSLLARCCTWLTFAIEVSILA
jgi:hypothetical protein